MLLLFCEVRAKAEKFQPGSLVSDQRGLKSKWELDAASICDPRGLSTFFLLGWPSSLVGSGVTEAGRCAGSVNYIYEYGLFMQRPGCGVPQ